MTLMTNANRRINATLTSKGHPVQGFTALDVPGLRRRSHAPEAFRGTSILTPANSDVDMLLEILAGDPAGIPSANVPAQIFVGAAMLGEPASLGVVRMATALDDEDEDEDEVADLDDDEDDEEDDEDLEDDEELEDDDLDDEDDLDEDLDDEEDDDEDEDEDVE